MNSHLSLWVGGNGRNGRKSICAKMAERALPVGVYNAPPFRMPWVLVK